MFKEDVDIGIIPSTLPCDSQGIMVYFRVSRFLLILYIKIFMKKRELHILVVYLIRYISVVMMIM